MKTVMRLAFEAIRIPVDSTPGPLAHRVLHAMKRQDSRAAAIRRARQSSKSAA